MPTVYIGVHQLRIARSVYAPRPNSPLDRLLHRGGVCRLKHDGHGGLVRYDHRVQLAAVALSPFHCFYSFSVPADSGDPAPLTQYEVDFAWNPDWITLRLDKRVLYEGWALAGKLHVDGHVIEVGVLKRMADGRRIFLPRNWVFNVSYDGETKASTRFHGDPWGRPAYLSFTVTESSAEVTYQVTLHSMELGTWYEIHRANQKLFSSSA